MPALQALKTFKKMSIEGNENSRVERRVAIREPKAMDAFAVHQLDVEALALNGPFSGQSLRCKGQAIVETRRRGHDDQRCGIELWKPDRIGLRGWLVRVSRETKRPIAG